MSQSNFAPSTSLSAIYSPQPLSPDNAELVQHAKEAIDATDPGNLTPDTHLKFKENLHCILEISPNKPSTAIWLIGKLSSEGLAATYSGIMHACSFAKSSRAGRDGSEPTTTPPLPLHKKKTAGRSTTFSTTVKSVGLCRVTGAQNTGLHSCHIIAFSSQGEGRKLDCYRDLIKAMFGISAWEVLLINVMNGGQDADRNVNRLDNGISLSPNCHLAWDNMRFVLAVDWETYNSETKEFNARFHWLSTPDPSILNLWDGPLTLTTSGREVYPPMEDFATVPFRLISPPPLPDGNIREPPPIPSAHLLYVRETLTRIAHIMGASEEYADDECDDEGGFGEHIYSEYAASESPSSEDPRTPSDHSSRRLDDWLANSSSGLSPRLSETAAALDLAILGSASADGCDGSKGQYKEYSVRRGPENGAV